MPTLDPLSGWDGSLPKAKKLYEGPAKCSCCKNWVDDYPDDLKDSAEKSSESRAAAILLRYEKSHHEYGRDPLQLHSISIQSSILRRVVRTLFEKYPGINTASQDLTFSPPFEPFFHRWDQVEALIASTTDEENDDDATDEQQHVELLVEHLKPELEANLEMHKALVTHGDISYKLLWTIYPPASIVMYNWDGDVHCLYVCSGYYGEDGNGPCYVLDLAYLDCDGYKFGWRQKAVRVRKFESIKKITELDVVPKVYSPDVEQVVARLIERGKVASELCKGGYKAYRGLLSTVTTTSDKMYWMKEEVFVEGRIVIDADEFGKNQRLEIINITSVPASLGILADPSNANNETQKPKVPLPNPFEFGCDFDASMLHDPTFAPLTTARQAPEPDASSRIKDVTLDRHSWTLEASNLPPEAFCRSVVRGYCLTSKLWAEFHVNDVFEIAFNDLAFEQVVMPPPRKTLVRAIVEEQRGHKAQYDDIVSGKGQGLIMLFSGPPGTGKTLTAEAIADRLRLPLYTLSATQLGDTAIELETNLNKVLRLASAWDAVLLLDEADAFLEKRTDDVKALDRNKRVAGEQ